MLFRTKRIIPKNCRVSTYVVKEETVYFEAQNRFLKHTNNHSPIVCRESRLDYTHGTSMDRLPSTQTRIAIHHTHRSQRHLTVGADIRHPREGAGNGEFAARMMTAPAVTAVIVIAVCSFCWYSVVVLFLLYLQTRAIYRIARMEPTRFEEIQKEQPMVATGTVRVWPPLALRGTVQPADTDSRPATCADAADSRPKRHHATANNRQRGEGVRRREMAGWLRTTARPG